MEYREVQSMVTPAVLPSHQRRGDDDPGWMPYPMSKIGYCISQRLKTLLSHFVSPITPTTST